MHGRGCRVHRVTLGVLLRFDLHGCQDHAVGQLVYHRRRYFRFSPLRSLRRQDYIVTRLASRPIPLLKSHSITPQETTKYLTILRGQHPSWRAPYIVGIDYGDTKALMYYTIKDGLT